jgi:hypothetical protein
VLIVSQNNKWTGLTKKKLKTKIEIQLKRKRENRKRFFIIIYL